MITPLIFATIWHIDAIIVCATVLGLLWQLRVMQPVAQSIRVCSGCLRVARGSDEVHGEVTQEIVVVVQGRRR